ncbi:hypothetical protein RhiirC2_802460 [Rhizophagus irregularis]|uniref:Uncharacterized protein n=1 Tax=Rhizophagus irregularis TaxID=588596 RepID=A0A2N1M1A5_9GLOM|nr:hypothetical protein RhiirC2_802460 [Rhizophagus irregularis]
MLKELGMGKIEEEKENNVSDKGSLRISLKSTGLGDFAQKYHNLYYYSSLLHYDRNYRRSLKGINFSSFFIDSSFISRFGDEEEEILEQGTGTIGGGRTRPERGLFEVGGLDCVR